MKLVTRHSSLVTALALAAASASAAGFRAAPVAEFKEGALSFGLSAGTTFVGGEAREHVFHPKGYLSDYLEENPGAPAEDRRHQLSRLDWDMASVLVGVSGSLRYDRLSLNLGVWYGGSGSDELDMDDYDWLNGDQNGYTHHSFSEVELTDAWLFDANLSFDFWRGDAFTGFAFAGIREQRWKWTQDGFTEYWYPISEGGHFTDDGHGVDPSNSPPTPPGRPGTRAATATTTSAPKSTSPSISTTTTAKSTPPASNSPGVPSATLSSSSASTGRRPRSTRAT